LAAAPWRRARRATPAGSTAALAGLHASQQCPSALLSLHQQRPRPEQAQEHAIVLAYCKMMAPCALCTARRSRCGRRPQDRLRGQRILGPGAPLAPQPAPVQVFPVCARAPAWRQALPGPPHPCLRRPRRPRGPASPARVGQSGCAAVPAVRGKLGVRAGARLRTHVWPLLAHTSPRACPLLPLGHI